MKQETKTRHINSKNASKHVVGHKLIWCLPEDYLRIKQLKENELYVSEEPISGNILKQFDIIAQVLGI